MRCKDCKNCKQILPEYFEELSYEEQRRMDCKNLTKDGQCDCYSHFHGKVDND